MDQFLSHGYLNHLVYVNKEGNYVRESREPIGNVCDGVCEQENVISIAYTLLIKERK